VSAAPYETAAVPLQRLGFEVPCGRRGMKAKSCSECAVLPVSILQTSKFRSEFNVISPHIIIDFPCVY
jgi:hypothetical protein